MNRPVAIALLALCGLAGAVGIGLAANEVTGHSVGLSADPLRAGGELAPAEDPGDDRRRSEQTTSTPAPTPEPEPEPDDRGGNGGGDGVDDDDVAGGSEDDSGRGRGRGRGDDDD
jgi:hypothetical protein